MKLEKAFEQEAPPEVKTNFERLEIQSWKRTLIYGVFLAAAFLLGLVPMWLTERETAQQRDAARVNLRLSQIQNRLATASIKVRNGEYEEARLATSDFFTDLRAELDSPESAFEAEKRQALQPVLAQRDDLITLLARNDQSTGDRLANLYLTYLKVVNPPLPKPFS